MFEYVYTRQTHASDVTFYITTDFTQGGVNQWAPPQNSRPPLKGKNTDMRQAGGGVGLPPALEISTFLFNQSVDFGFYSSFWVT